MHLPKAQGWSRLVGAVLACFGATLLQPGGAADQAAAGVAAAAGASRPPDFVGEWIGSAEETIEGDRLGGGTITWRVTSTPQGGVRGEFSADDEHGLTYEGKVVGALTGGDLLFTMVRAATPEWDCEAYATGNARVMSSAITGTYRSVSSCHGIVTDGRITLTKRQ